MIWLLILATACFAVAAFEMGRVLAWTRLGGSPQIPPRDVRLCLRLIAPDLTPEIDELWPRR